MAVASSPIVARLSRAADTGFDISNKFYRVIQVLPSAVAEYTTFAEQTLYLAANFEQIAQVLPSLSLSDDARVFEDIAKLLDFADEAFVDCKEALPQRPLDEVDLLLPYEAEALVDQIEALQAAATIIATLLLLGAPQIPITCCECDSSSVQQNITTPSRRLAESLVNQLRRVVRTLKLSQPRAANRRGIALKRSTAHTNITDWVWQILQAGKEPATETGGEASDDAKPSPGAENPADVGKSSDDVNKVDQIKFDHFGAHPKDDGMPLHIRHHPDQVYAKIHKKDLDERTLNFYGLPWTMLKDDPNYFIIWQPMEVWECDNLFAHTKKLRINEEQASINPKAVVDSLLKRWSNVNVSEEMPTNDAKLGENYDRQFEKDLQELKDEDEKPNEPDRFARPIVRDRSYSPQPIRSRAPVARRYPRPYREIEAKTEYWRPWGEQNAQLFSSLKYRGWLPVYMRGTAGGQTWYYGSSVVHVRRFTEDYTPQDGPMKLEEGSDIQEYLIISTEWIEEESLQRMGFQYQLLRSGHFSLDPRLTWGDIELLIGATSTFREERLYRKYRTIEGGDLHAARHIAIPEADFLHGPQLPERTKIATPYIPSRLETTLEEPVARGHDSSALSTESHDSFVEITK